MKQKTLIFTDCDGTILNNKGIFSKETIDSIKEIYDSDSMVILTTARRLNNTKELAKQANIDKMNGLIIANNGAQIYDFKKGKLIFNKVIKKKFLKRIFNNCFNNPLIYKFVTVDFISENFIFSSKENKDNKKWSKTMNQNLKIIKNFSEITEPITNVRILFDKPPTPDFYKLILEDFIVKINGNVYVSGNGKSVILFSPPKVSKGGAIKKTIKYLDAKNHLTIAFGDNFNDMSMKKETDLFFAMKNGIKEIKQISDEITEFSNDEDGVIKQLKRYEIF